MAKVKNPVPRRLKRDWMKGLIFIPGWNGVEIYMDQAKRPSRCRMCNLQIIPKQTRLVVKTQSPWRPGKNGGKFSSFRYFYHPSCFRKGMGRKAYESPVVCGICYKDQKDGASTIALRMNSYITRLCVTCRQYGPPMTQCMLCGLTTLVAQASMLLDDKTDEPLVDDAGKPHYGCNGCIDDSNYWSNRVKYRNERNDRRFQKKVDRIIEQAREAGDVL